MNDPVWSVNLLVFILVAITTGYIYYILRLANKELEDGENVTTFEEKLLQYSSDRDK